MYFILLFLELQYTICPYDTSRFFFPVHILFYMVFLSEINLDDDDDDVCLFTVYCIYAFAAFLRMIFLKKNSELSTLIQVAHPQTQMKSSNDRVS